MVITLACMLLSLLTIKAEMATTVPIYKPKKPRKPGAFLLLIDGLKVRVV
jgi:hypothetical protein